MLIRAALDPRGRAAVACWGVIEGFCRFSRSLFRLPNIPMVLGQGLLCCKAFVTMSASVLLEFDVHVVYMVMVCTPPIPTCFICSASMEPAVLLGLHCDNLVFKKHVESF